MDILIGFSNSGRELDVKVEGDSATVVKEISDAIAAGKATFEFAAEGGVTVVVKLDTVAYVKVGPSSARKVGFSV